VSSLNAPKASIPTKTLKNNCGTLYNSRISVSHSITSSVVNTMVDVVIGLDFSGHYQWSFRKIGTMGTLASKAEIDAWVQTPRSRGSGSITPEILVTDCMVCKI